MKKVKTASFNGVRYEIEITGPIDGLCTSPKTKEPHLFICTDLKTKTGLTTAIHESLHACSFLKSEVRVERTAKDIARLLWRLGYRCGL